MKDLSSLVSMFLLGALLGAMYLAGLWCTVRGMSSNKNTALRFMTSLLTRMGLLAAAFYFIVAQGDGARLVAALAGFVTMRTLTVLWVRRRWLSPDIG